MGDFRALLPRSGSSYQEKPLSFSFLVALTVVTTVRSLDHIVLPDGGASSRAGLGTSVGGGENIIAMSGHWELEQLLLSPVMWVVILRYRYLVPVTLLL